MRRVGFHLIKGKGHKKKFGPYTFSPCSCGCTDRYGIGFQFIWFGIKLYISDVICPPHQQKHPIFPIRSGQGWTLANYQQALNALRREQDDLREYVEHLEKAVDNSTKKTEELEKEVRWISKMTRRIMELGNVDIEHSTEAVAALVKEMRNERRD